LHRNASILVAGAETFVGAALVGRLRARGYPRVLGGDVPERDLRDAASVEELFAATNPDAVVLAAGRSGGIARNQREPADLLLDNLLVQTAVIEAAHRHRVSKLLFLASACIYPRECPQPMRPEQIGTGPIEPTSQAYATAKIAGLEMCRAFARQYGDRFVTAIPANVFGPGDDVDPEDSHVVGALLCRMHAAKLRGDPEVVIWGSGRVRRDFLFVGDLAAACEFLLREYDGVEPINVSSGSDVAIAELAERIRRVVGYEGRLLFDPHRPDGAPLKTLDAGPLRALGWKPETSLDEGLAATYRWLVGRGMKASDA
jgi:GDP-L-fucose synthase